MDNTGLFTPMFESDVDKLVRHFAKINATLALYNWLYSRAFALKNQIGISQKKLAGILGVNERTVRNSVKYLKDMDLISTKTDRSIEGGGTVFSLKRLPALKGWIKNNTKPKKKASHIRRDFSDVGSECIAPSAQSPDTESQGSCDPPTLLPEANTLGLSLPSAHADWKDLLDVPEESLGANLPMPQRNYSP